MQVNVVRSHLEDIELPIALVGFTEEETKKPKDEITIEQLSNLVELGDFKGEKNTSTLLYSQNVKSKRLMFVGLGKEAELNLETLRKVTGSISRIVRDLGVKHVGLNLSSFTPKNIEKEDAAEALVQAITMGSYNEAYYKTKELDKIKQLSEITLFDPEIDSNIEKRAETGRIIGEAVNYCRKLAWGPGNLITPTMLAGEAERIGKSYDLKVSIFDREKARKTGLHSFLAVARGTDEPPRFIIIEYGSDKKNVDTVALVGKGITFDTGGISLKPGSGMPLMKADMTGGAIVLSVMEAVAKMDLNLRVIGIVPATDNMPDGKAYHPGDVVNSYSGQTIEVVSTDAEGRMILNDGLSYAAKNYKPTAMFDFATLTGSMHVALGDHAIGYFANIDWVSEKLETASQSSGERVWRMPLWEEYDEQLKSDVADFKHTGGRPGGAITAARFLSKFVMGIPWAHLDIAGHSEQKTDKDYNPKGSKGPAVRLVIELLRNWS